MQDLINAARAMRKAQRTPTEEYTMAICRLMKYYQKLTDHLLKQYPEPPNKITNPTEHRLYVLITQVRESQQEYCTFQQFKDDWNYFRNLKELDMLLAIDAHQHTVNSLRAQHQKIQ